MTENKQNKTILITNSKKLLITQIIFCTLIIIFFSIVITLGILPNSWELTKEITENVLKWTGKQGIFILSGFSLILLITLVIKPKLILTYFQYWIGIITMIIISFGILGIVDNQINNTLNYDPETNSYYTYLIAGKIGTLIASDSLILGTLRIILLFIILPLIIIPRLAIKIYTQSLKHSSKFIVKIVYAIYQIMLKSVKYLMKTSIRSVTTLFSKIKSTKTVPSNTAVKNIETQNTPTLENNKEHSISYEDINSNTETKTTPNLKSEFNMQLPLVGERLKTQIKNKSTQKPSIDLFDKTENIKPADEIFNQISQKIETTLEEHGVHVSVGSIKPGSRVIRFGLIPGWSRKSKIPIQQNSTDETKNLIESSRVKVHSITAREKDLALALKTPHLTIQAPVPGEAVVGIDVPNPNPYEVKLRTLIEHEQFNKIANQEGLPIGLGENVGGEPISIDLLDMPHLLIAGATGSGKSVCINSIIDSLIFACSPEDLRLIMVDPKRVELTPFNDLPHLVYPVVVEMDETIDVLDSLINEMFARYKLLEEAGTRNIKAYREKTNHKLPYLVLIIDELADLMMASRFEAEQLLVRLAQLGRATGIHLILATQRPSVNVVTGLMKANIPSRVAFAVASQVDSRVILDVNGAEKLLGKGDMLFLSSDNPQPIRLQGTFLTDSETSNIVDFWKKQNITPPNNISLKHPKETSTNPSNNDFFEQAKSLAIRQNNLSPSILQRKLQIGYPKALELINQLEKEGFLSKEIINQDSNNNF